MPAPTPASKPAAKKAARTAPSLTAAAAGRAVMDGHAGSASAAAGATPLHVNKVRPAYHQVAEQLRSLILGGDLSPGARLPTEPELSAMFGVSRSTVREALRVLSSQHLVVTTRGATGGTSVAFPEPEYIGDFLEASFGLMSGAEAVTIDQFLELREQIEVPAARLAAERRTEDHLTSLKQCMEHTAEDLDGEGPAQGRANFHSVMLEAAGNPLLAVVARPVVGVLRGHFLREQAPPQFWRRLARDHEELYALVEAGEAERAAVAMKEHLTRMRPVYNKVIRPKGGLAAAAAGGRKAAGAKTAGAKAAGAKATAKTTGAAGRRRASR